jgi:hypothetical protein
LSSRRNKPLRPAILWLLVAAAPLAFASPTDAFELKLWPLATAASDGGETRFTLLGPLVEWRRDSGGTRFAFRPLVAAERDAARNEWRGSVFYPVAWWENGERGFFLRLLGLVTYERKRAPAADGDRRAFTLFPFVFYRERADGETSFALLPLYANLRDFAGYARIKMLFFPLYLSVEEPLVTRSWFPFPFLSTVGGRGAEGFRVWPAYGHTRIGNTRETTYVGWPFYIRDVRFPEREDRTTTRITWPIFSTMEGPKIDHRIYGFLLVLPVYTHTIDRAADTETWGFPWPAWLEQRRLSTGERLTIRYAPFYQDRRTAVQRSVFYLWPLYRHRKGLGDDATFERTDLLFVLYRDQHEGEGPTALRTRVLFPLFASRERRGGSSFQALTFVDGLFPKNPKVAELWAPLLRVYGSETREKRTERDLFWRAIEWGDDGLRPPWYLSLAGGKE